MAKVLETSHFPKKAAKARICVERLNIHLTQDQVGQPCFLMEDDDKSQLSKAAAASVLNSSKYSENILATFAQ